MIVVVAAEGDRSAAALAGRWGSGAAALLTPADLSVAGWVVRFPGAGPDFVAGGIVRAARAISGVLVRLPQVEPGHLSRFAETDRQYAAAEMTAFLAYWLRALPVTKLNVPTPLCLPGPGWSQAQWLRTAARLGLAVRDLVVCDGASAGSRAVTGLARERAIAVLAGSEDTLVTVVGREAQGGSAAQRAASLRLAGATATGFLAMRFAGDSPILTGVSILPPLTDDVVAALERVFGLATAADPIPGVRAAA